MWYLTQLKGQSSRDEGGRGAEGCRRKMRGMLEGCGEQEKCKAHKD